MGYFTGGSYALPVPDDGSQLDLSLPPVLIPAGFYVVNITLIADPNNDGDVYVGRNKNAVIPVPADFGLTMWEVDPAVVAYRGDGSSGMILYADIGGSVGVPY